MGHEKSIDAETTRRSSAGLPAAAHQHSVACCYCAIPTFLEL